MKNVSELFNNYSMAIDVGFVHMGYALYNSINIEYNIFNINEAISKIKFEKNTSMPAKRITVLTKWFKEIIDKYNITILIVEKQVSNNILCMQIQNALLTLACVYNIKYKIFDPKNKFQYIPIKFNSKKKEHKQISIHYAYNILYNLGLSTEYFKQFDKKDDISDAICMAIMDKEDDNEFIKYLISDHTNNKCLSNLTHKINFKLL